MTARRAPRRPHGSGAEREAAAEPSLAEILIDPVLAIWERVDRRRRAIRLIRPGGVLGLEVRRYRGSALTLSDGTIVRPGDPLGLIHFENARLGSLAVEGWQTVGWREGRADLRQLAAWAREQASRARPVAYTGTTLLWPIARRAGFEVRARRWTRWARIEDAYFRSLLRRWNPPARTRLRRGGELRSAVVWLSDAALQRRYGS